MKRRILSPQHPLWYAGFRPFFILALSMGLILPITWGLILAEKINLPRGLNPMQWHAHEMLFGFGGAVLFGFLLTASKNWVNIRGINGTPLMALTFSWLLERVLFLFTPQMTSIQKHLSMSLFTVACGFYIITTLIKYRQNDSFKDNYFFSILLITIVIAKNYLLSDAYCQDGISMTLGLFRLAFTVMFERTITQFMKNTENLVLYRNKIFDFLIKFFVLLSVFQSFIEKFISPIACSLVLSIAASLLIIRWFLWQPNIGFKKFGNATMYIGYLGLTLHFIFEALKVSGAWSSGSISTHIFTFLCMGVVIPSMLIRISQGHTGRKPSFVLTDKIAISLILVASLFRLGMTQVLPEHYLIWVTMAAFLWTTSFAILAFRLIPFLLEKRIDGKVH